jgi:hypothetical protein
MDEAGFFHASSAAPGVFLKEDLESPKAHGNADLITRWFRYATVLDEQRLDLAAVYEWSGNPCIYFKSVDDTITRRELNRRVAGWHRTTWNNGLARMLWVVTPTEVRVFNAYVRPPDDGQLLDHPDIELFKGVAGDLAKLKEARLHRRDIESGAFWETERGRKIQKEQRIDYALLEDLNLAAGNLKTAGLTPSASHRLLLQTIFIAFLEARKLLPARIFRGLKASRFGDVVANSRATRQFFNRMHDEFDGDLFPMLGDDETPSAPLLTKPQLDVVWRILNKTEQSGQQRFWPYDFSVVPIELVSSIYETFLRSQEEKEAEEQGVHYTPLNLVDLVLTEVFDAAVPLAAKVLDLSCGSGIFLVESFRRLVARRVAAGEKLTRGLIRRVLYDQVFGVDIQGDAVDVAAFSLSLTALEMEPAGTNGDPIRFARPLKNTNLFVDDAFDLKAKLNRLEPFAGRGFDIIVGNPPWTAPKGKGAKGAPKFPPRHIKYCETRVPPFPLAHDSPPDPAFVRRAADFATAGARFGLILAATRFFSLEQSSRKMKLAVMTNYCPALVINLSQVHRDLFPEAEQPAIVLVSENRKATAEDDFTLLSVERSASFKRHGALEIGPESARRLPVLETAREADALKVACWGTPRDWTLVKKLWKFRELRKFLADHGAKEYQGYIRGTPKKSTPAEMLEMPLMEKRALRHCLVDVQSLDKKLTERRLEAPREVKIYRAPLLLLSRSLLGTRAVAGISSSDIVFSNLFTSVPFKLESERVFRYLNALLNSSVATYFLFLTSPVWGIERYEVRNSEWMRVPIPRLSTVDPGALRNLLAAEAELRETTSAHAGRRAQLHKLDQAAFDIYGLSSTERILVADLVDYTIDFQRNHEASKSLQPCSDEELDKYATHVIRAIQPLFRSESLTLRARRFTWPPGSSALEQGHQPARSVRAVGFSFERRRAQDTAIEVVASKNVEDALAQIAEGLDEELSRGVYTRRHLRIYNDKHFYVIKPNQRRCWTASAAMADADAIIGDHLRGRNV